MKIVDGYGYRTLESVIKMKASLDTIISYKKQ